MYSYIIWFQKVEIIFVYYTNGKLSLAFRPLAKTQFTLVHWYILL